MPLPATHLQSVQATVKMANASDLSLRGGQRPTWRPEREARGSALGVQSREGSHVDRTRHCRGAACRSRRRTYSPYKPPSKWQTLPICHCEEANGRRGNLGKAVTISPIVFLGSGSVLRDCHVASLLAMTRQGSAVVHQRSPAVELLPTGRSLSAATVKFGSDRVRRHSVYIGSAFPRLPRARSALAMTNPRTLHG